MEHEYNEEALGGGALIAQMRLFKVRRRSEVSEKGVDVE